MMESHRPGESRGPQKKRSRLTLPPAVLEGPNWAALVILALAGIIGFIAIAALLWRAIFHHF